jgi:hypothetical protein
VVAESSVSSEAITIARDQRAPVVPASNEDWWLHDVLPSVGTMNAEQLIRILEQLQQAQ